MLKPLLISMAMFGAIASTLAIAPPSVQALPEAQIVEKLQKVPVFTITNNTGNFLQQQISAGDKKRMITPVYMELKDAAAFLKTLKQNQPQQAKLAQITIVPLSEIYKLQQEARKKSDNVNFVFFPSKQQLQDAGLLKKPYQPNAFYPVPLFVIAIQQGGKFATVQENNLTPLFLSKQQAKQWLERVRKKDPKLAAKAQIKVNYLQVVLDDFQKQNYEAQKQLVLVPSAESLDSIRKLQQAAQKNGTVKPGATVVAPKK